MDWEILYSYTRKQAIHDGVLIDITTLAKEAGFKVPVAITDALYCEYIKSDLEGQDANGRLWDVLYMLSLAARNSDKSEILFDVIFIMSGYKEVKVTLKAVIGPGDDAEPVLTIMLEHED